MENLQAERDSLLTLTNIQDSTKAVLDEYVEIIASTLDSIKINEKILTIKVDDKGKALKKSEIKENLQILADVLKRQRERIEELESQLLDKGIDSSSYYRSIILHLYGQLEEKNNQILAMQQELEEKHTEVKQLNNQVSTLKKDVVSISDKTKHQNKIIEQQTEILEIQDAIINKGYLKIGSKRELQEAGIVKGTLISQLNTDALSQTNFDEIDIRYVTEITLSSARPKILTSHPGSSYVLEYGNDGSTVFRILDPSVFWSISNYLVIQL